MAEKTVPVAKRETDPQALRADIAATRQRLGETLDVVQYRLSPGTLKAQAINAMKQTSKEAGYRVRDSIRENPWPLVITGAGLAWALGSIGRDVAMGQASKRVGRHREMEYEPAYEEAGHEESGPGRAEQMREQGQRMAEKGREQAQHMTEKGREQAQRMTEKGREQAQRMTEKGREQAHHLTEKGREHAHRMREQAQEMGHRASEFGHQFSERASQMSSQVRDQSKHAMDSAQSTFTSHPLTSGLAALAAGIAAGLIISTSRKEQEWMGSTSRKLMEEAKTYGQDMAERGKHVAERSLETAKEEAKKEGQAEAEAMKERGSAAAGGGGGGE